MIDYTVRYLHAQGVFFRLISYPAPEPAPSVAHLVRPTGMLIDVHLIFVDGSVGLGCVAHGESVNLLRLRAELGSTVVDEANPSRLPCPYRRAAGYFPPLGGLLGGPVFVDPALLTMPIITFNVFGPTDFIELAYDDFARVERPRVVDLAGGDELPPASVH